MVSHRKTLKNSVRHNFGLKIHFAQEEVVEEEDEKEGVSCYHQS